MQFADNEITFMHLARRTQLPVEYRGRNQVVGGNNSRYSWVAVRFRIAARQEYQRNLRRAIVGGEDTDGAQYQMPETEFLALRALISSFQQQQLPGPVGFINLLNSNLKFRIRWKSIFLGALFTKLCRKM